MNKRDEIGKERWGEKIRVEWVEGKREGIPCMCCISRSYTNRNVLEYIKER